MAVYSREPIEPDGSGPLRLGLFGVPQIRAVTRLGGRRVAVYNVHLLPPRRMDYTREHRRQLADLLDRLAEERLPLVLAGDFNFTPRTPDAEGLGGLGLADAHARGGWGRGTTWPVNSVLRWLPGLRLDQIWTSPDMVCVGCRTGDGPGSDHRPVVADFILTGRSGD
jgi:endonuclease/exonuclease/phosphatase (EEP) superfamily protein YafD